MRPIIKQQIMGELPTNRVSPSRAFLHIGIELCGPFNLHYKIRTNVTTKAYISIFICFSTKAVHLEVIPDLSTKSFLSAFRRFVARRGKCSSILTDNATNFIGSKNELQKFYNSFTKTCANNEFLKFFAEEKITWKTIPPRSPHFGGLWEAAVTSQTHHRCTFIHFRRTRNHHHSNRSTNELQTINTNV